MVDKFVLLHVQAKELLLEDALQSQDNQSQPRYKWRYPTREKYISTKEGAIIMNSVFMKSEFKSKVQKGTHQIQERRMAYSTTPTTLLRQDFSSGTFRERRTIVICFSFLCLLL